MCLAQRLALLFVISAGLGAASCGAPPDREMQQAQGAIDAARAVGAAEYARDEFVAAQDTLKRAEDAVAVRDYRLALNHALDSRERAQTAAKQAADGKAIARVEADRAITALTTILTTLQTKLKAAEAARLPPRLLAAPRKARADGERRLQEARTAMDTGRYAEAAAAASEAKPPLAAADGELEAAVVQAARRRRR